MTHSNTRYAKPKIACITMDIERDLHNPVGQIRLWEDAELRQRYIELINRYNVKLTGFVVTNLLPHYGSHLEDLAKEIPLEFAVHSHTHNQQEAVSYDEVQAATQAHHHQWQSPPLGYRAPNGLIDHAGFANLLNFGYVYDTSIFPSIRMDEYGYSNFGFLREPFIIVDGERSIVEFPVATLAGIRLVFSLSYVKLLGLSTYKFLLNFCKLPDIVVVDTHPYDFYTYAIQDNLRGWKKYAHLRNARQAFDVFEGMLKILQRQNYQFMWMSELYEYAQANLDLIPHTIDELPLATEK